MTESTESKRLFNFLPKSVMKCWFLSRTNQESLILELKNRNLFINHKDFQEVLSITADQNIEMFQSSCSESLTELNDSVIEYFQQRKNQSDIIGENRAKYDNRERFLPRPIRIEKDRSPLQSRKHLTTLASLVEEKDD